MLSSLLYLIISAALVSAGQIVAVDSLVSQFSLTTSTSIPFPTATQANAGAQAHITSAWSLSKGRIQNGAGDLTFVDDPFPKTPTPGVSNIPAKGPVLQVTYPAGSFSHDSGGAQLFSLWNTSNPLQSVLLTYEVAFDQGFDWVKGGKLPGLRGGPNPDGCTGGNKPNGTDCFSARLMWRKDGKGEGQLPPYSAYFHLFTLP